MRIVYRQSGGWGNLIRGYEARTEALPLEEAEALEAAVETSGLLEGDIETSGSGSDVIQHEINIELGGKTYRARFDDVSKPTSIDGLLQFLRPRLKPIRPW